MYRYERRKILKVCKYNNIKLRNIHLRCERRIFYSKT